MPQKIHGDLEITGFIKSEEIRSARTPTVAFDNVAGAINQVMGNIPDDWEHNDTSIKSVVVGTSAFEVGRNAFRYCTGINCPVAVPGNVDYIDHAAFAHCSLIPSVTFAEGVRSIGYWCFEDNFALTTLSFPSTLRAIGSQAFDACTGLSGTIIFPDGLEKLRSKAFINCTGISAIELPASLTELGSQSFFGASSLTNAYVDCAKSVIASDAFSSSGLTTIHIKDPAPDGWTIGSGQTIGGKSGVTVVQDWS